MKIKTSNLLLLFLFLCFGANAQTDSTARLTKPKKGTFYFGWGYNKNYYSTTDVRVHDASGDYDFTLYDMKAHDHTHFNELLVVQPSIPQYGYRIGYWMPNQKYGIELKFDHAKYIVYDYQTVHLKGRINDINYDTDTLVDPSFMHLEHTDGANFLMLNFMYRMPLLEHKKIHIYGVVKYGAGIVIPRSDVTLFGQRWNHCFHVAGQVTGAEAGVRAEFGKYFFIEPSVKGVFCNYNKVLAIDDALISHRFWDGMILLDIGFQIPMGKAENKSAQPTW
jgi:hypothetical protein